MGPWTAWCALALIGLLLQPAGGAAWALRVTDTPVYNRLNEMERQTYGQTYDVQDANQRINRLEQTHFGRRQPGSLDVRYQQLVGRLNEKNAAQLQTEQGRLIDYLEQKLFEQTYADQPLASRVKRLENQVFGKTFDDYPMGLRIKKLTYTMPIMARGVRVKSQGAVVAATGRLQSAQRPAPAPAAATAEISAPPAAAAPVSVASEPHASEVRLAAQPAILPVSYGDYLINVHRVSVNQVLRWQQPPVRVYVRNANPKLSAWVDQAMALWNRTFSFQRVNGSAEADVILDAQQTVAIGGLLTRPIINLDEARRIRTVVLVGVAPMGNLTERQAVRALAHQLGHAAGIWGHSDEPNDLMYPLGQLEQNDIPALWLRRSPRPSSPSALPYPDLAADAVRVTQRDSNTLTRLYDTPAQDIKTYSPYQSR